MGAWRIARPRRRDERCCAAVINRRRVADVVRPPTPGAAARAAVRRRSARGARDRSIVSRTQFNETPAKLLRLNGLSLKPCTLVDIGLYCVECAMGENGSCCAKISCACV